MYFVGIRHACDTSALADKQRGEGPKRPRRLFHSLVPLLLVSRSTLLRLLASEAQEAYRNTLIVFADLS